MKQITEYELLDHGIDGAQYFQGCGVCWTKFDMVYTGAGSNFAEAIEDCLEQIADSGKYELGDLEQRIWNDENYGSLNLTITWPTEPNTNQYNEENEESDMYYYVSIRLR